MKILAFETSATPGGIALLSADQIVYETGLPEQRRTTESFASEIRAALRTAAWSPQDVELFAICRGPGSFTGLRIGITAAKIYAYATGCQVIALDTLDVIAAQSVGEITATHDQLWSVLDAQRQQLFAASYSLPPNAGADLPAVRRLRQTQLVDAQDFLRARSPKDLVTGSGLQKWQASTTATLTPKEQWSIRPAMLGRLAWQAFRQGQRCDVWNLVPDYGRASAAEEKRQASDSHGP